MSSQELNINALNVVAKDESKRNSEAKQQEGIDNKPSKENLQESAKNTSETALNNAIKQSSDPEVRQTAHEELKRRESEEKPQEEGNQKDVKSDNKNNGGIEDYKIKLKKEYTDIVQKVMNIEDFSSDEFINLSNKQREYSRYIQKFSQFNEKDTKKAKKQVSDFFEFKSDKDIKDLFGDGDILEMKAEIADDNSINIKTLVEDGFLNRTFDKQNMVVSMEEFYINPSYEKGRSSL